MATHRMTKVVMLEPYDSLFFGGGVGVPLGGYSPSMLHPSPMTVSGAILSFLVDNLGRNSVLSQSALSNPGDMEQLEERGMAVRFAFHGPFIYYSNGFWVPAPRDLVIVWAKKGRMNLRVPEIDPSEGRPSPESSTYKGDAPSPLIGPGDLLLYEHFELPLINVEELNSGYYDGERILIREMPAVHGEDRLGIGIDRNTGTVRRGLLYTTTHIRVEESQAERMKYAMLSVPVPGDGKAEVPSALPGNVELRGITRLGGEGRPALLTVREKLFNPFPSWELEKDEMVRMLLISPAIYAGGNGTTTSTPDLTGLPGRPEFVGPRLITSRPLRISGWSPSLGRARKMFSAVPPGTVYYLRVRERVRAGDLLMAFWKLSLYWDRGMGSPLLFRSRVG